MTKKTIFVGEISFKAKEMVIKEMYRIAGKCGANFGKSPIEDESGDLVREEWLLWTKRFHELVRQAELLTSSGGNLEFDNDLDFVEFFKNELQISAHRISKEAFAQVGDTARRESLEQFAYVFSQMRDQLVSLQDLPMFFKVD